MCETNVVISVSTRCIYSKNTKNVFSQITQINIFIKIHANQNGLLYGFSSQGRFSEVCDNNLNSSCLCQTGLKKISLQILWCLLSNMLALSKHKCPLLCKMTPCFLMASYLWTRPQGYCYANDTFIQGRDNPHEKHRPRIK